jgi:hypothetical protein
MKIAILIFGLMLAQNLTASELHGNWQVASHQLIGYTTLSEQQINDWLGNVLLFDGKTATKQQNGRKQTCLGPSYTSRTENAEAYFLIGLGLKPQRLGINQTEIKIVNLTCRQRNTWLGNGLEFVFISAQQVVVDWEGVLFFLNKIGGLGALSAQKQALMLTPQALGKINPNTKYNDIAPALSGYQLRAQRGYIEASRGGQVKLKIYPNLRTGMIAKIFIYDEAVVAPGQVQLGLHYNQVFYQEGQIIDCTTELQQSYCSYPSVPNIEYIFDNPQPRAGRLVAIHWTADSSLVK